MRHKFVVAYGPWRWFLATAGYRAVTMPWRSIYVLRAYFGDKGLREHELVHIAQIERLGSMRFIALYLFYLARYGYRENPLDKEAYGETPRRRGGGRRGWARRMRPSSAGLRTGA